MRLRVGIMMLVRRLTGPLSSLLALKVRLEMSLSARRILNCHPKRLNFMRSSLVRVLKFRWCLLRCVRIMMVVRTIVVFRLKSSGHLINSRVLRKRGRLLLCLRRRRLGVRKECLLCPCVVFREMFLRGRLFRCSELL